MGEWERKGMIINSSHGIIIIHAKVADNVPARAKATLNPCN